MVKSGLFFYFEILCAPSEIPANLPGQFSLSIYLHWSKGDKFQKCVSWKKINKNWFAETLVGETLIYKYLAQLSPKIAIENLFAEPFWLYFGVEIDNVDRLILG